MPFKSVTQHKLTNSTVRQACQMQAFQDQITSRGVNTMPLGMLEGVATLFNMKPQADQIRTLADRLGYDKAAQKKATLNDLSADLMAIDLISSNPMEKPLALLCKDRLTMPCLKTNTCFQELMNEC